MTPKPKDNDVIRVLVAKVVQRVMHEKPVVTSVGLDDQDQVYVCGELPKKIEFRLQMPVSTFDELFDAKEK